MEREVASGVQVADEAMVNRQRGARANGVPLVRNTSDPEMIKGESREHHCSANGGERESRRAVPSHCAARQAQTGEAEPFTVAFATRDRMINLRDDTGDARITLESLNRGFLCEDDESPLERGANP